LPFLKVSSHLSTAKGQFLKILSVAIAIGSSIQIALLVAPVLVLASYFIAPQPLNLVFSRGLLWAVFLTVLIGVMVAGDGRANWFKGVQLIMVYVIMAVMFYFLPNSQ
jgi:Ca2+:H+ antiporter